MKRRDLLLAALATAVVFVAVGAFHTSSHLLKALQTLREIRSAESSLRLPVAPFLLAFARMAVFHVVAGLAAGLALGLIAALLVRPVSSAASKEALGGGDQKSANAPAARRGKYYGVFSALLAAFLLYVHLRMITLYPGLFRNSYRYEWLAGSAAWAFAVAQAGRVALVLLGFALVLKYRKTWSQMSRSLAVCLAGAAVVVAVVALALYGWNVYGRKPLANAGSNIIFVGVDSVRPDHLSAFGYPRATTPSIDEFLRDAVVFQQAFVPLCRTHPSWASILTGCHPPRNGVRFNLPPREVYAPLVPTLAQHVQALGYSTAGFLNNSNYSWFEPSLGFQHICQADHNTVDFYFSHVQPAAILYYYFLNNRLGYFYEPGLRYNAGYAALYRPQYFDAAVADYFRRMRQNERFLAVVHLCNLHAPLAVNYPYSTYFRTQTGPVLNRFTFRILVEEIARRKAVGQRWSKEEAERIFSQEINLYDAMLRSTDDSVGRVLAGLKRAGLYDNSLIVLLSDHGEHLFENGLRYRYSNSNHGNHMWGDQDQRAVLAIKFPRRQYAGRAVERLVRAIDIAPTILDALDLPPLDQAEGVSLMPYVKGSAADMNLIAYAETGMTLDDFFLPHHLGYSFHNYFDLHEVIDGRIYKKMEYMPNLVMAKDRMVRDERWKLIVYPIVGKGLEFYTELFDVAADPNSVSDVSTVYPAERDRLFRLIEPYIESDRKQWESQLRELPVTQEAGVPAPPRLLQTLKDER